MTSETAKHRETVAPYLNGNGLDLGSGGDPVVGSAISVDLPPGEAAEYTTTNWGGPLQWRGDARDLSWLRDRCCDYVYSSHLLEDFANWQEVLIEWMRVIKRGGRLVLLVPDQKRWAQAVDAGQPMNSHHAREFNLGDLSGFVSAQWGWVTEEERFAAPDLLTEHGTPDFTILYVGRRTH